MTAMEKIEKCGVVPVVVLDRAEDAVPTAEAMLRGGVNVMEITFRTAAAPDTPPVGMKRTPPKGALRAFIPLSPP